MIRGLNKTFLSAKVESATQWGSFLDFCRKMGIQTGQEEREEIKAYPDPFEYYFSDGEGSSHWLGACYYESKLWQRNGGMIDLLKQGDAKESGYIRDLALSLDRAEEVFLGLRKKVIGVMVEYQNPFFAVRPGLLKNSQLMDFSHVLSRSPGSDIVWIQARNLAALNEILS